MNTKVNIQLDLSRELLIALRDAVNERLNESEQFEFTVDRFFIIDVFADGIGTLNKDGTLGSLTSEIISKHTTEYRIGIDSALGRDRTVKMEI